MSRTRQYLNTCTLKATPVCIRNGWLPKSGACCPFVRQIVRQGVEKGEFSTQQPELAAEFLLVGVSFWLDRGIFTWTEEEYAKKKQAHADIIHRLLGGAVIAPDNVV